jgi:hypothetical protein
MHLCFRQSSQHADKHIGAACLHHSLLTPCPLTQGLPSCCFGAAVLVLLPVELRAARALHCLPVCCPLLKVAPLCMCVKRKIKASLFFGGAGGAAVLRPARASGAIKGDAGGGRHAQLVGLAQHCDVRVCITSWLPVTMRLASSCCICSTLCGRRSTRASWARRGGTHTIQQLAAASAAAALCMPRWRPRALGICRMSRCLLDASHELEAAIAG